MRGRRARRLQEARRLRLILAALAATLLAAAPARAAPPAPVAGAWLVVDARDGKRLAGAGASRSLPIASTTKLMTALLALRDLPLDRRLSAPDYRPVPGESLMGLKPGERDSVRDLLYGMLLPSGNDAAATLAAGDAGSVPAFVAKMNAQARHLGLADTHYANPIGLDSPGNYSSARDLVALTRILRRNPVFRRIVATRRKTVRSGAEVRHLVNSNTLLRKKPFVTGVKTGTTLDAQHVLITSAARHGVSLVAALLGAPSETERDAGSLALLRYGFSRYRPVTPLRRGSAAATVGVRFASAPLALLAGATVRFWARRDQDVRVRIDAPARAIGPIPAGRRLGTASVSLDGRAEGTVPLRAARAIPAPVIPESAAEALPGSPVEGLVALAVVAGAAFAAPPLRRSTAR